jgi:hypothetical protein
MHVTYAVWVNINSSSGSWRFDNQDNVHETNVCELHFEDQHFFVCVSVDEIVFEKAPWGVGSHPPSNSQSGTNTSSELLKDFLNYSGFTQFAMNMYGGKSNSTIQYVS